MSRRVLITGATGFVGSLLGRSMHERGWSVHAIARDPAAAKERLPFLEGALAWGALSDGAAFEGMDALVHLAGEPVAGLWTASKRERIERSRVEGTRALVDGLRAASARPKVLVSASAVGYYGEPAPRAPITEAHPAGEGFLASVCAGWEREAERAEDLGVRVVRLRIGLVMGRGGGVLAPMLPAFKAGLGGKLGSGEQLWPWIHQDDVVRMIEHAIDDETWSGAYNAVSPHPIEQARFAKTLASILRRPAFVPAPAFALRAVLGDFADETLVSRRVLPERALAGGFEFRFSELEPALRDLLGK